MQLKTFSLLAYLGLAASLLTAQNGISPRPSPADYPVQAYIPSAALAATALSPAQLRSAFTTNLNGKGFIVLEVAFYPTQPQMNISPSNFQLKIGDHFIRPSDPAVVAHVLRPKDDSPTYSAGKSVQVVPSAEVYHESYPGGVYNGNGSGNANGNTTSRGGWGTSTGVAVYGPVSGAGASGYPSQYPNDRGAIEAELTDKSLPDNRILQPTAGFLYFSAPSHFKKDAPMELDYSPEGNTSAAVHLNVPPAANK